MTRTRVWCLVCRAWCSLTRREGSLRQTSSRPREQMSFPIRMAIKYSGCLPSRAHLVPPLLLLLRRLWSAATAAMGAAAAVATASPPVLRLRSRALPPAPRRPRSRPPTRDRPKATRRRTRRRSKETPTLSVNTFRVKTVESSLDPLWRKFSNPGLERRCVVIRKNIAACSCPYSLHASVPCCAP